MNQLIERSLVQEKAGVRISKISTRAEWSPDIAISRDPGSGGHIIAERIAAKLGWHFLDKQIMADLAHDLGIPEEEFANIDEHQRSWIADTLHSLANPNYVSDTTYINHLKKLLMKYAKQGDIVILGRGANHLIPPERCLRVRITASFKTRVERTYKFERKKTMDEAEDWVREVQRKRDQFIFQYFGEDAYSIRNYDLIVNTDYLSLDTARDLIIQAYLAKFPSERRRLKNKL